MPQRQSVYIRFDSEHQEIYRGIEIHSVEVAFSQTGISKAPVKIKEFGLFVKDPYLRCLGYFETLERAQHFVDLLHGEFQKPPPEANAADQ